MNINDEYIKDISQPSYAVDIHMDDSLISWLDMCSEYLNLPGIAVQAFAMDWLVHLNGKLGDEWDIDKNSRAWIWCNALWKYDLKVIPCWQRQGTCKLCLNCHVTSSLSQWQIPSSILLLQVISPWFVWTSEWRKTDCELINKVLFDFKRTCFSTYIYKCLLSSESPPSIPAPALYLNTQHCLLSQTLVAVAWLESCPSNLR